MSVYHSYSRNAAAAAVSAVVLFAASFDARGEWLFNGVDAITQGEWKVAVSIENTAARELKTPSWIGAVKSGSGDLDLSTPIRDANGNAWSLVKLGEGAFSKAYYSNSTVPVKSLVLPSELRAILSYCFDDGITNLVVSCPKLKTLGNSAMRMNELQRLVLNAPSLPSLAHVGGSSVFQVPDACVLDLDTFNLNAVTNLKSVLPRHLSRKGVIRLPSLQTLEINASFQNNSDITGLVLGGASEDGSALETLAPNHSSIVEKCASLEFIVVGAGENQVFSKWSTFSLSECDAMKRIFFAGAKPTFKCGSHFSSEPGGARSLCFYIRPDEPTWQSVVDEARALTEEEAATFRSRFGDDEPLPIGTIAASVFGTTSRQFLSYGDYRQFCNDVIVCSTRPSSSPSDFSPQRIATSGAEEGSTATFAASDVSEISDEGKVKHSYSAYTVETFDGNGWTGDGTTNFSQSVTLQGDGAAKRITWHWLPSYRVTCTDRGFLEEYPETFSVEYPDGEPDADGFLAFGKRVTVSVTGFDESGDHPGRFVEWDGDGVESLSGQGAVATFTVNGPISLFPRVEHQWKYTPPSESASGLHEVSDGNWRLAVNKSGENLNLSGETGWGWCYVPIAGSGFLELPTNAVDSAGKEYAFASGIYPESFLGCTTMRGLRIPPIYKSVGIRAFHGCSNVKVLELPPNTFTSIGEMAFRDMSSLGEVEFVQTNLAAFGGNIFSACTSLTNLHLDIPNVKNLGGAFHELPLVCDASDWNVSSVTGLFSYAGFGSETRGKSRITGTLHLPSIEIIESISLPCDLSAIDFDRAVPRSVSKYWGQWNTGMEVPLNTLIFRGRAPSRNVLDNLLISTPAVDGNKRLTIYCSRAQTGWPELALTDYTENELAAAEVVEAGLAEKERLLGVYATQDGARKAWVVHRPSPYDKGPLNIIIK